MGDQRRFAALTCLAALLLVVTPSSAHGGPSSYCTVREVAGGLDVELEVPLALLAHKSEPLLDLDGHVRATTPGGQCTLTATGPEPDERASSRRFQLDFACPNGPVTFSTDYGLDVDRTAEVVCAIDGIAHVFRDGALDYVVGTPPSLLEQLSSFVRQGALHVFGGLDHVLFVLSLLLGVASPAARDPRSTLRRLVGIVTGFTLGHSVTLIIAALGIWRLPAALTESLIALSIVLVAVQNLFDDNPRKRAATAALFGLVHGFGFASALAQIGLPSRGTVPTLLAFNLGIELAQLAIVLACFPLLVWSRRQAWFRTRLLIPGCCSMAGIAGVWLLKRAFGLGILPWLGG
jgi:HupE / UreJ protein